MAFTIKDAEGRVAAIEEDYGNAEELKSFLDDVAELDGSGAYVLTETIQADRDELAAQEAANA